MKPHYRMWATIYAAALTLFTVWLALDTFVLPDTYQTAAGSENTTFFPQRISMGTAAAADSVQESSQQESSADAAETTALSVSGADYADEHITVTLHTFTEYDTVIYAAEIQLSSAEYLKTAFAKDIYGKNVTAATSSIAAAHDAVLAVNGDFYGARESGYVIRNGTVYRDTAGSADLFCLYADGHAEIVGAEEQSAQALVDAGVWQAWSFGPALLENGEITVSESTEVGHSMASNPRTAIGVIAPLHYVLLVSDGRTAESGGLSLLELAQVMQELGVQTAYNLDGGGSSTMYFQGEVINNPTTNGRTIKERSVSDIVYVG